MLESSSSWLFSWLYLTHSTVSIKEGALFKLSFLIKELKREYFLAFSSDMLSTLLSITFVSISMEG